MTTSLLCKQFLVLVIFLSLVSKSGAQMAAPGSRWPIPTLDWTWHEDRILSLVSSQLLGVNELPLTGHSGGSWRLGISALCCWRQNAAVDIIRAATTGTAVQSSPHWNGCLSEILNKHRGYHRCGVRDGHYLMETQKCQEPSSCCPWSTAGLTCLCHFLYLPLCCCPLGTTALWSSTLTSPWLWRWGLAGRGEGQTVLVSPAPSAAPVQAVWPSPRCWLQDAGSWPSILGWGHVQPLKQVPWIDALKRWPQIQFFQPFSHLLKRGHLRILLTNTTVTIS